MKSLRGQVQLLATGTAALVIALAAVPLALMLRSTAWADAEREATFAVQNVADYVSTSSADDAVLREYVHRANHRSRWPVTVVAPDAGVLGGRAPDDALAAVRAEHKHNQPLPDHDGDELGSLSETRRLSIHDARIVSILVDSAGGRFLVFATVDEHEVEETIRSRYLGLAGAAVVLLAMAAIASEMTTRRVVLPLSQTAQTAGRLSAGELDARAPESGPTEVAQVAVELNALAGRIDELLTAERESAADLSHRLRTPLTAVRLGVEALPPSERSAELEQQVANLERTLTYVIRAARRPQREGVHPRADACAIARDRLAFWAPLAEEQGRAVTSDLPDARVCVRTSGEDLATALDALIENVFAHTPDGTSYGISVQPGSSVTIDVYDEGPGIPEGASSRGHSDRGSSGLGLDIARAGVEATGGTMTIRRDGDRTVVRLSIPACDP